MFFEKLHQVFQKQNSLLCIGLDPDLDQIPDFFTRSPTRLFDFNRAIIDATHDVVIAYKPNIAFYEQVGLAGWDCLQKTIAYLSGRVPVILDAKRSDIGHTAMAYARAAFDVLGADAVTVNPLLGEDSVKPFLAFKDRGVFILALTSNPGAHDFQKQSMIIHNTTTPLYLSIIDHAKKWSSDHPCGFVVGATQAELPVIRINAPDSWFLIPGIGAQGGDLNQVISSAAVSPGDPRVLINVSRSILYGSHSSASFSSDIRREALRMKNEINRAMMMHFDS